MKAKFFFSICIFLVAAAAVYFFLDIMTYARRPADLNNEKVVAIHPGEGLSATAKKLNQDGIIVHPEKFRMFARLKGYDKKIKAGEFLLSSAMSPDTILNTIVNGKVILHKLTIPEGYNIRQVANLVAREGLATEEDFILAASDASLTKKMSIGGKTFEGYLFPDTYYFPKGTPPRKIISIMAKRFRSVFNPKWIHRAEELGFSVHEITTLASIIEKETGAAFERPIISSVFHNRLKKHMRLETDPTVIYGIDDFDGNITRKHLKRMTPYNTYRIKGLPPGPIANPGLKAIEAALYPDDTRFLYFVSKRDTTHKFSTNIKDHNMAVRKYQILRR
ncbi:MAG: endolytic transglycosylase MltG [Desulfobacterales bacterium]|nr:endolytic transglycosylase MltG [Desulfobacterales bacterium]